MDNTDEETIPITSNEHVDVYGGMSTPCKLRLGSFSGDEINTAEQSSRNFQCKGKGSEKITERSMDTLWVNVRNSTSSVFARSTISTPNSSHILLCLSVVIKTLMDTNACSCSMEGHEGVPYFCTHATFPGAANEDVPDINSIYNLLEHVFIQGRLSPECIIIALIYINRVMATTGLHIDGHNWQGIICGSFLLSQKVWDDYSLRVSSFAKLFVSFTEDDVRLFEIQLLKLIGFDVSASSKMYAQYYFEFRDIFEKLYRDCDARGQHFPLKPLEMWRAKRLEIRSDSFKLQRSDGLKSATECAVAYKKHLGTKSIAVERASYYEKCGVNGRGRYVQS